LHELANQGLCEGTNLSKRVTCRILSRPVEVKLVSLFQPNGRHWLSGSIGRALTTSELPGSASLWPGGWTAESTWLAAIEKSVDAMKRPYAGTGQRVEDFVNQE
jgi:hypothetical protein